MTPSRFQLLLDTYGADLNTWPATQAGAARTLIQQSPEARHCLDNFAGFDSAMALGWEFPGDVDAIASRVMTAATMQVTLIERRPIASMPAYMAKKSSWMPAGAFAAAALALFLLGTACGMTTANKTEKSTIQTFIIDGPYRSYASL